MDKKAFKVVEIALDSSGTFYVNWAGAHPEQGGLVYKWGGIGFRQSVDSATTFGTELGKFVGEIVDKNKVEWAEKIKEKEKLNV